MTYISIEQILDNLLDNPLLLNLKYERAVNYAVEFIRLIGVPTAFEDKVAHVEMHHGKGKLPCDVYEIQGVKDKFGAYRYTTDTFHMDRVAHGVDRTYKRLGMFIFSSTHAPMLEVAYTAFKTDEEGLPMIPDNQSFITALELYIKLKHYTTLFEMGLITPAAFHNVQLEYTWYAGQAQAELNMITPDLMESITAMLNQLITKKHLHTDSFAHLGTRERYKRH